MKTMLDYIQTEPESVASDPIVRRLRKLEQDAPDFLCRCGRWEPVARMVDLDDPDVPVGRRISVAVRERSPGGRRRPGDARRFVCCACWTDWIRTGQIDRNEWRRAINRPEIPAESQKPW